MSVTPKLFYPKSSPAKQNRDWMKISFPEELSNENFLPAICKPLNQSSSISWYIARQL